MKNNRHVVAADKLEFHDTDTDTEILARILADTRDFLKLFISQVKRHADILATTIIARMSARKSVSVSAPWNASFTPYMTSVPDCTDCVSLSSRTFHGADSETVYSSTITQHSLSDPSETPTSSLSHRSECLLVGMNL